MFECAPTEVFLQESPPVNPPDNFYMESEPVTSGGEDLSEVMDISIRLADFGVGTY